MEKICRELLSYSLAKASRNGLSFIYNDEKFVSSEDYPMDSDIDVRPEEMSYYRFFEYLRRYMDFNIDMFEEHELLVQNSSNKIIKHISFDADIYHYHKDHLIFAIRHNVYHSYLDPSVTDNRTTSIASTSVFFDKDGITINDKVFLENFMFAHNTNELRINMVVQDIENEPVIIMTIKPYNYGLLSDEESKLPDEELDAD